MNHNWFYSILTGFGQCPEVNWVNKFNCVQHWYKQRSKKCTL